ncbi:MAG: hypothetical protein FWC36_09065 [Spirochaetes bacterium]|nr:hypothetical protein [Spirochaetota bacterium]
MSTARQLISERKFNEAVKILAEIVKNEPNRLDEVESQMAIVRSVRNQYNLYYEQLIAILRKEDFTEQDIIAAYGLIDDIMALDPYPDQTVITFLEVARRTVAFRYHDIRFRGIMDRALALILQARYWEAIALYTEAIGFYRGIFIENRPEHIIREADNTVQEARETINRFLAFQTPYLQAAERARRESARDAQFMLNSAEYNDLVNVIRRMAAAREEASAMLTRIEQRVNQLLLPIEFDIPYLSSISTVMRGRRAGAEEGVFAAIGFLWDSIIDENTALLTGHSDTHFSRGRMQFNNGQYRDAEISFGFAKNRNDIIYNLVSLRGYNISAAGGFDHYEWLSILPDHLPQYYEAEKKARAANDYILLSQIMQRITAIENNLLRETVFNNIITARNQVVSDNRMISVNHAAWQESEESMLRLIQADFSVDNALAVSTEMKNLFGVHEARLNSLSASLIRIGVDLVYLPVSRDLQAQLAHVRPGFEMVDGIQTVIGEGDAAFTITARYNQRAMELFTGSLAGFAITENNLRNILTIIYESSEDALSADALREPEESINNDLAVIASIRGDIERYMQISRDFLIRAEVHRTQADRFIADARANLDRDNFDVARESLRLAGESYASSLSLNEDPVLRANSDREIFALSDEILRRQSAFVVEAVRRNINEARDLYTRERFGDAENILQNSQTLWRTVNDEDVNPELEFWLSLVRTALSVRTGRVIAEADPLFREMTQVLNLARNDYLNAIAANQRGNRAEMLRHLNQAEEKLLLVTIPFPINQEASVLSLRIMQLRDQQAFNVMFRERYDMAVGMIDVNPGEAHLILNDLRAINPNFPGIDQAIIRTEIRLGMRTPPPDPARIREAETLLQRANAIFLTNVRSNFPIAIAYLNRAFELNPNDGRITALRDRVQTEIGGTATIVLSSEAQQQYRLAEQEFINGNFFTSLAIVERLLQDPRNRNYTPLLELRRRIEARI